MFTIINKKKDNSGFLLHVETHYITYRHNGDDGNGCDVRTNKSFLLIMQQKYYIVVCFTNLFNNPFNLIGFLNQLIQPFIVFFLQLTV